jgi:alanyl-tRNA synthetase
VGPAHGGEDRFIEFWNLVFMQFEKGPEGSMTELPKKNIDTGAGFERVLSILNGVESVFATDLFTPLLETAARAIKTPLGRDEATDVAIRRIAEHGRAMTMLVSDGVLPSNEGRGYVLRRIIRRAILAARRAGSETPLAASLVDATIEKMGGAYPGAREGPRPHRRGARTRGGRLRAHAAHRPRRYSKRNVMKSCGSSERSSPETLPSNCTTPMASPSN